MPSMPTYHVSKGSQFGFLDTTLGGADFRTELDAALTRLQGADPAAVLNTAAHARVAPNRLTQNDFGPAIASERGLLPCDSDRPEPITAGAEWPRARKT